MNARSRSYVVAIALVLAATVVRLAFLQALEMRATYITFYPAVILAALYGGLGPSLLATALSALLADYFWIVPAGQLSIREAGDWLSIAIFLLNGAAIAWLTEAMHRARSRAAEAEAQASFSAGLAQANAALRESEARLNRAQQIADVGSWEWEIETGALVWSEQIYRQMGEQPNRFTPSHDAFVQRIHAEDRAAFETTVAQALVSSSVYDLEFRIVRPDGAVRVLHSRGEVLPSPDGRPCRMIGVCRDVTERRQAEAEIFQTQQRLQAVMQALPVGVAIFDAQGGSVGSNPAFEQVWGGVGPPARSVTDYGAYHAWWLDSGQLVQPEEWASARAVQHGETVVGQELEIQRFDGTRAFVLNSAAPIRDNEGHIIGSAVAVQDITERKRVERELDSTARKYAAMFATTSDGVWIHNLQGEILEVNDAYCQMSGYSRDELMGMLISTLEANESPEEIAQHIRKLLESGGHDRFESRHRRRDGTVFDVDVTALHLNIDGGRIAIFVRDITQRKASAQALLAAHARVNAILEQMSDGFATFDRDWRYTHVNAAACQAFHMRPEQLLGKNVWELWPPADDLPIGRNFRRAMEENISLQFECFYPEPLNRWFECRCHPTADGLAAFFSDITERKQTEQGLQAAREQLRLVTDTMSAPVTRCSRDLHYVWVSRPYAAWLGCAPEEIAGRPIAEILGDEALRAIQPYVERVLSGERAEYEQAVNFKGLGVRWINAIYMPTFDGTGVPDGWVAVVTDVTRRKELEQALRDEARRKDEFLAMLAHELRNPLAPIRNAVHILRLVGPPEPRLERARDMIDRQVTHMVRLIDDLLDISRITRGKISLRKERVDLAAMVEQACETVRPLIAQKQHTLTVSCAPGPIQIEADPARLVQVISNLLNNAAKFTGRGGSITISTERSVDQVIIRVRDTGVGITPEVLPRIFDLFVQGEVSLDRTEGGLGIGLTLVKHVVERHGGSVEARSAGRGCGSEFIVTWPALSSVMPIAAHVGATAANEPGRRLRILLVEDSLEVAESFVVLLEIQGHEVRAAQTGPTALDMAATFVPDVAFIDLGLPGLDGYEVARRLRAMPSFQATVLVALTGYGQEEDKKRAQEAGFDHHLTKPVEPSTVDRLLMDIGVRFRQRSLLH